MHQDLLLRALCPEDEPALSALFTANDSPAVTRWFDPFPLTRATAGKLTRHSGRDLYWGVWANDEMVAFAMVRGWDEGHEHRAYGYLVDHRHRRRGIGTAMTTLVVEELLRRGESEVRARVHDDNEASLRMLMASGFRELDRREGRVILGCRLADAPAAGEAPLPTSRRGAP